MKKKTHEIVPVLNAERGKEIANALKAIGGAYQKAHAFDLIASHRDLLADVTRKIQALAKSTSKGQGTIMSQLLGQKMQIERTIELIFNGLR